MKKTISIIAFMIFGLLSIMYAGSIKIRETQIPILTDREDNVLFDIRADVSKGEILDNIVLKFDSYVNLSEIKSVKLYY